MRIVVHKYGGSSVATVEKLKAVAAKVVATRREGFGVVVVVSAMGNTTDDLLGLAREVSDGPPKRELDMLLSAGERISMALLSIAIQDLGERAISFTGSQCGIVTTHSHANARIIDVRPFRVQDELEAGNIVIVAGYQGTSYKREITTLGRGGSDTTAVALAAALGAERCDIFSDVDGVYSSDPRVVLDAERLDEISYEEMQELARTGARVLNEQAVEFARRRQIAIYARSTFKDGPGTVIRRVDGVREAAEALERADGVRGVSTRKDIVWLRGRREQAADVLAACSAQSLLHTWAEGAACAWILSGENMANREAFASEAASSCAVEARTDVASVSAVGEGVGGRAGALARFERALSDAGVEVAALFTGRESVSALVKTAEADEAARAVHAAFIGVEG